MKLEEVLGYIPKEELEQLSINYKVDHQVKKLHGQTMFQLLLFFPASASAMSLRPDSADLQSVPTKRIKN